MKAEKSAALTMVWKSYNFLEKWIEYYGRELGFENLFVLSHGEDERIQALCSKVNLWTVPREFDLQFDVVRWQSLSDISSALLGFYERVIVGDCDELILLDPNHGASLSDELLKLEDGSCYRAVGFNTLPVLQDELVVPEWNSPMSTQFDTLSGAIDYCKPAILTSPVRFKPGGHDIEGSAKFDPRFILLHLKYIDVNGIDGYHNALKQSIRGQMRKGADASAIGTHWKNGAAATDKSLSNMLNGNEFDGGDYIARFSRFYSNAIAKGKPFLVRKNITKGKLPERFIGMF